MQKDQKFNLEVSSKDEVDSQCSCPECDSATCFLKRQANEYCGCASRAPSGLYTYFTQGSKLLPETKHTISKPLLNQEERVPDLKKNTRKILCEFINETNKNFITDSTTTLFKVSNTSFSQVQGNSRKTSSFIKDSRGESKKDKGSNVYCYRKKAYRKTSVDNVELPKDAACQNMSAVVDHNMPHQDLQAPIPKTKISSAIVNLSAVDIYNKIEEAYRECSCEVCECVVGKSLQNEFCGYKPCEWHGGATLSECMLSYIGSEVIQNHDEQCFCLLCDKKSCKVFDDTERKLQDYHGYHDNFELQKCGKDCDCKRCECMKCKARPIHRTLIVAPVEAELQPHNACRCAPCECFECRHRYSVTANGQREVSTGVNRHPHCHCEACDDDACIPDNYQSCRCVRQSKVMSKPVERDSNDYDIRTAQVTYNNKGICEGNFETLAMFAALPSSYTKRIDQSKQCICDHCECLHCDYFDCTNSQNVFQSSQKSYELDRALHGKIQYYKPEGLEPFKQEDRRVLDMCDRIDCDNLVNSCVEDENETRKLNRKYSSTHICDFNICEFVERENTEPKCFKNRGEDASVDFTKLVKSRKQTRLKNNDPLIQSCIDTLQSNKKIFKQYELSIHASKSSTSIDNFGESQHPTCRQVSYGSHRIFCPNFETDSVVHEHISECANEIDLTRHNKQTLNSSLSLLSSKSFVKESESVTHVTSKIKSRESSCNSSGYDYPDYLAHFPKLTIKTCLDDVLQCNFTNNVMFNMGSNYNIGTKSSHFSVRDGKSFPSQTIKARSSKHTKVNCKASQTFNNDIQKYIGQIRNSPKETRKTYTLSKCKVNPENEFNKFKTDSASTSTTNTSAKVAFNEEYIRIQKTLRDAREYSQHLVSLFEKYEKANKEFESVSERIKNSNYSMDQNINKYIYQTNKSKDTFVEQEVPTKDSEYTFKSAFDEIDHLNKQENYIDNRDNIQSWVKPVNILPNEGNHGFAFIDTNHTITEEKHSKYVFEEKRSIVKKLNKRPTPMTKCAQGFVTPQNSISQSSKLDPKQGATVKNDSDVVISDSRSLGNHRHFQESLDTKVIDTVKTTDGHCNDKNNISEGNIAEPLVKEVLKPKEERKSITVKRDFQHTTSTKFSKNTNLSNKGTTELINLSKNKSIVKPKIESSKIPLENQHCPLKDEDKSEKVKHEEIISLPNPHESQGKIEVISHQPVDEHTTYTVNQSKALHNKSIVNTKTEISKQSLENVDIVHKSDEVKHEEIVPPPPRESDGKATAEVISYQPVDEHYVNKSKALEKVQSEVKRILDLPFLQVVKDPKKSTHDKNCEAMKVTAMIAQRISDHSVAVKWKAPTLSKNVIGYEVLIDGRFVQRITNPSRRMAVISCLPPADKVLLTVRTVVAVPVSDHYPAVTLVYHTRKKSETLMHSRTSFL